LILDVQSREVCLGVGRSAPESGAGLLLPMCGRKLCTTDQNNKKSQPP